ncbi:Major vault protein alpha-like [Oopsacas minuta]|uniref:Major vault protein n=1 Tax=Oopsacas minuta TaxID=111878 RepID=A0AAV7K4C7_9METZ|nr:Major vault protein alpha-like [Oopsacas minuta]
MQKVGDKVIGIRPLHYVHILNRNNNVTSLDLGPKNLVLKEHESLIKGPFAHVILHPGQYCVISDPVIREAEDRTVEGIPYAQRFGEHEVKLYGEPFPLYPGETMKVAPKSLPIVLANHAIKLEAKKDFIDGEIERKAGDIWQLKGPLTYTPQPEVDIKGNVSPIVIKPDHGLKVVATRDFVDEEGVDRLTGHMWMVTKTGAYLLGVFENLVERIEPHTITENNCLHMKAIVRFTDVFGRDHAAGEEWLVTLEQTETYLPCVEEELVQVVDKTILGPHQFCVILNPIGEDGHNKLGRRLVVKGRISFFLRPGERLENGIQQDYLLEADQSLLVQATEEFTEEGEERRVRQSGEKWLILGPCEYIPDQSTSVIAKRKALSLNQNEGVYVRNVTDGKIRSVLGPQCYILKADEELYEKPLSPECEKILKQGGYSSTSDDVRKIAYFENSIDPILSSGKRDRTKVITYRCPHNTAIQVYDYVNKTSRVLFGPDLVMLQPHENFNVLSLSAGKPKMEGALKSLCLMLGPDYITDSIIVETSDHARLSIFYSVNNHFEYDRNNPEQVESLFALPDFIGFAARHIASRVRASVSQINFDNFHKHSAAIVSRSVFGVDAEGNIGQYYKFPANNLVITNIDIRNIEPEDKHMRDSLFKSVTMAIEIAINSTEAAAQHDAERLEQKARGLLERQKLTNEQEKEKARKQLLLLQAECAAIESSGMAKAEAQALAEKMLIECKSEIEVSKLKAEANEIELDSKISFIKKSQAAEIKYQTELFVLDRDKTKSMAEIEINKFGCMVDSLGSGTLRAIGQAGPTTQKMLENTLGYKKLLSSGTTNPLTLFSEGKAAFS